MTELQKAQKRIAELEEAILYAALYMDAGKAVKARLALALHHPIKKKEA